METVYYIALGAAVSAFAGFLIRDSLNESIRYIQARRKSRTEWFDQTTDYLQRLVQAGTNLQASPEITEEKLQEIEKISKELPPHVRGAPRSLDADLEDELIQIGYISGWAANLIRDLREATTLSEIMDAQKNFKRRMNTDDIGFDELLESVPEEDLEKWNRQVPRVFNQIGLDMGEHMALVMEMLEEADDDIENPEDLPWEVADDRLDNETLDEIVTETLYSLISVILVEIPEEGMQRVEEAR